jgi:hypothetical protein
MTQPTITPDQRDLAVTLLANALRKDAHLWRGHGRSPDADGIGGTTRWRVEASRRYAQGMTDLLAVLFDGGRPLADDCLRAAEQLAFGPTPSP